MTASASLDKPAAPAPKRPLLAYAATDDDGETGNIIFARNIAAARRAIETDEYLINVSRAAWADRYAQTSIVPINDAIQHGWHFECWGCGRQISYDNLVERKLDPDKAVGTFYGQTFCCDGCKTGHDAREALKNAAEQVALDSLTSYVHDHFPDVTIVNTHCFTTIQSTRTPVHIQQLIVAFTFPGSHFAPCTVRYDFAYSATGPFPLRLFVASGDHDAWTAYRARVKADKAAPAS